MPPKFYNLKQELEEMERLSPEQKERLKYSIGTLQNIHREIDYNYREYSCIDNSLELLEKAYKF